MPTTSQLVPPWSPLHPAAAELGVAARLDAAECVPPPSSALPALPAALGQALDAAWCRCRTAGGTHRIASHRRQGSSLGCGLVTGRHLA